MADANLRLMRMLNEFTFKSWPWFCLAAAMPGHAGPTPLHLHAAYGVIGDVQLNSAMETSLLSAASCN